MAYEGFGETQDTDNEQILSDIDQIFAWLIEKGAEDSGKSAQARQALYQNLNKLGVVNSSGNINISAWTDFVSTQFQRKNSPVRPDDYPDEGLFLEKFAEYAQSKPEISKLEYHTKDLPKYLYGLGIVMSDKIVYESIFENDKIQMKNGEVVNGKHREAAQAVLRMCSFNKQTPWVNIEYEN